MAAAGCRSAVLLAAAALAGCTSVVADARTFEGTSWSVTAINGRPAGGELRFAQGQLGGTFGCNRFSGPYRIVGNSLRTGPMAATQMACASAFDEGPDPMAAERMGFAIVGLPMRIEWRSGGQLRLVNAAGSIDLQNTR